MELENLKKQAEENLLSARKEAPLVQDENGLNLFKGKYLGKKSPLSEGYSGMRLVPKEQKKEAGAVLTGWKKGLEEVFSALVSRLEEEKLKARLQAEKVDITLPGIDPLPGGENPYDLVVDEVTDFFLSLGYKVADGPEVETDENNFERMNIPKDHPARDMQDSFSLGEGLVLRSHTSAVQARVMEAAKGQGPIKVICPGKVYRRDNDATHSHQFGQIEGLVISEDVTFASLLDTLTMLLKHLFGEKREVRFRPSFFPFTEPSVEADISCFACNGKGCALCKHTGYIEVLGSGMVHPNVLRLNGFDDKKYQGFAFGIGIDRIAMLKYDINDIKDFYTDDVSFLESFQRR